MTNQLHSINLKSGEVFIPDSMILLPIFSPARSKKVEKVVIDDLFGFKDITITGTRLNTGFHKRAYRYLLAKYQKNWKVDSKTTIVIDEKEMLSAVGIKNTDFPYYTKELESLLKKLYDCEITYTSPSGVFFYGRLVNSVGKVIDGVRTINLGDIFDEMLKSHAYSSIVNYLDKSIKEGIAKELKEILDILLRKISKTETATTIIKAEYLKQTLQLGGNDETNLKNISKAFDYFVQLGFLISYEKTKPGREVVSFKVTFNKNFNVASLDVDKKPEPKVIAAEIVSKRIFFDNPTADKRPSLFSVPVAKIKEDTKEEALAKIEKMFDVDVNPDTDISGFDVIDDEFPF